ncbi:MAG: ShlB/FhaC/HecB family hemolysin secretion/activation protein [Rhizomicrobium sp.]
MRAVVAGLCLLAGLSALSAAAQDFKQIAPKEPKTQMATPVTVPPEANPVVPTAVRKKLLDSLLGLRFVDKLAKVVRNGVKVSGVEVDGGLPLLNRDEIKTQLSAFLGRPLYTDDLPRISEAVVKWYRAHDLPVVDVGFPEQDISTGTVQAVVTVYRLGQVHVQGNEWFSTPLLTGEMRLEPGDRIDFQTLRIDLNRLNRNPFRRVSAVLERSATTGATDLALKVDDRLPFRVYASFDNDGLPVTNRERYGAGINWGNVFGLDQQISYQFLTSPDLFRSRDRGPGHSDKPRFTAHSLDYLAPLPWGDDIEAFGSYVELVPDLGQNFDQVGHSLQLSVRYVGIAPPWDGLSQTLKFGFDYKRSDNNIAFGGTQIFANTTNIEQFLLIYDGTLPDAHGQTAIENQVVYSPGGLSNGNSTAVFAASGTAGAKANYLYDNIEITRVTYLPYQFSSVVRVEGQIADAELLPSEQLGAGGNDSVRGYDPRTVDGSQGALFSAELHGPAFHPLKSIFDTDVQDQAQGLVFYDMGFVAYRNAQQNLPKSATLQSAGLGLRYGIDRFVDLRADYGWQLQAPPGGKSGGSLLNLSVTLAY